ncbi:hypothetical protein TIFTF001_002038 [Ficus carica]|uniref:VWFA domain-containing protein n=1 Tax=Ficus carica TaxID=3494 RepID=A0AA87Z2P5_FICCA|nr:hypothetical protein TIFTF001_002038 [Ficus carica]
MSFNDDEPIVAIQDVSEEKPEAFLAKKTKVTIFNKPEAPLEESEHKVMLELRSGNERSGVDLVTVLDVSGSMEGEKLAKLKSAMEIVISKLSPIDRLSVVTFAGDSRSLTDARVVGILLMSDVGQQNAGGDAAQVPVGNVPVYTFGFGADRDPKVLKTIAKNSMGGTFSNVQNQDNLRIAFSQCLAGLLTVVVQDLKLTVTQIKSTSIEKVSSGNYPQSRDVVGGSVTVSFGDRYNKKVRKVMVDLLLPAVGRQSCCWL